MSVAGLARRFLGAGLVGGVGLTGVDYYANEGTGAAGMVRLSRSVGVAVVTMADYKANRFREGSEEELWERCHERGAQRFLDLCERNGGLYIKFGQHVAQLDYLVPHAYCRKLSSLLASCRPKSIEKVRETVVRETGTDVDQTFSEFSSEPIAVASLAQVHTAVLRSTGEKVAVKVQHQGLQEASAADLFTVTFLINVAHKLLPDFDFRWLAEEAAENIVKELDFALEGGNLERCQRNIGEEDTVVCPKVHWDLTTSRLLTMSFESGCHILDVDAIRKLGLRPADVSAALSKVFAEQIFVHGFLHGDPHGGNVLVRNHPDNPKLPQLVLLDHGLYKELSDDFRLNYAKLWNGMLTQNVEEIRVSAASLGADGKKFALLAAMLTLKTWDQVMGYGKHADTSPIDRLDQRYSEDSSDELRGYAQEYFTEISELLNSMPRTLLMVLKTNDNLRSVDRALGSPLNTLAITAELAARAVAEEQANAVEGRRNWGSSVRIHLERIRMRLMIISLRLGAVYIQLRKALSTTTSPETVQ